MNACPFSRNCKPEWTEAQKTGKFPVDGTELYRHDHKTKVKWSPHEFVMPIIRSPYPIFKSLDRLKGAVEKTGEAIIVATQSLGCDGLGDATRALTPEEQVIANAMEDRIEGVLDEWYPRRNKNLEDSEWEDKSGVAVSFDDAGGNERIEDYIIRRFTGWRVKRNPAGGAVVFWPK